MSGLQAHMVVERERFRLEVSLIVEVGSVLAVLGPNGAGKSTALGALAGLIPLDGGSITLAGRCLDDPSSGVLVPAPDRRVGVVFQDYLLFPHLSALDNVAFGLRARGIPRRTAREQAQAWLDRVELGGLAGARPSTLSGGQAQRVALARALAPGPDLLLLDEPLSALDAGTRMQVRTSLRRHLADSARCTVLVTHDPLDAMVLADRVVVVEDGRVVQEGAPADVARAPRTEYVARLVGLNLYRGIASGAQVQVETGGHVQTVEPHQGPVFVAFAPAAVGLHVEQPAGSARNAWPGRVAGLEQRGDAVRVEVAGAPSVLADITAAAVAELRLDVGAPVWVSVKASEITVYPV